MMASARPMPFIMRDLGGFFVGRLLFPNFRADRPVER
jgi:hypothetical protein